MPIIGQTNPDKDNQFYAQAGAKVIVIAGIYVLFGGSMYHWIEKWSFIDSYYFVVVTLATIGYGDIAPTTPGGRLFTIFYIIFGLAIFSALISNIVTRARQRRERRMARKNAE